MIPSIFVSKDQRKHTEPTPAPSADPVPPAPASSISLWQPLMAFSAWVWGKLGAKVRELVREQALSKLGVNVDSMKWFVEQRPVACMEACLPWRDLDRLIVQGMWSPPSSIYPNN